MMTEKIPIHRRKRKIMLISGVWFSHFFKDLTAVISLETLSILRNLKFEFLKTNTKHYILMFVC